MANRYWVGGNGTWNNSSTTNWSTTSGGAGGASTPTATDDVFFDRSGSYTVSFTASNILNIKSLTMSAGTVSFAGAAGSDINIKGSMDLTGCTLSFTTTAPRFAFEQTSGAYTVACGGNNISPQVTFGVAGSTATGTLQDAFSSTNSGSVISPLFTSGTLDLNGKTLTAHRFYSDNSNTRTLAFNGGNIVCLYGGGGAGSPAFNMFTQTGLTVTGTPIVNITYSGATATGIYTGTPTEANSISFNITSGTYPLSFLINATTGAVARNVNFTGFAGSWAARTVAVTLYGSLTVSTGMTFTASTGIITMGATSGTQILTTNGKTFDEPLTINGVGGTFQLGGALTMGATRALTLTNGTFNGAGFTISGASSFSTNGTVSINNINTALAFTHTSGTMTLAGNCTFGAFTFTAGSINL